MTVDEYLRMERHSPCKHEFVDGVVYAMAGASLRHNDISRDVSRSIEDRVLQTCRPYLLDAQVQIKFAEREQIYYPDVVVTCSELDVDEYLIRYPTLIVEVLSKTTEELDRREKFDDYRNLPSFQEYMLVHQERACVELFRRRTNWTKEKFEPEADITLESVQVTIPISAFYRRVKF